MRVAHTATIRAPIADVWRVVMDIPVAARCVPGVAAVTPSGPAKFRGSLLVQVGPVRLVLDGDISVVSRDDAAHRASLRADAKDSRLGGTVRATIDVALREQAGGCELRLDSDIEVAGRIGEFGQSAIQRKATQLLGDLATCLGRSAGA